MCYLQYRQKKEQATGIFRLNDLDAVITKRLKAKATGYNAQDKLKGRLTYNSKYDCWNKRPLTYEDIIEILKESGLNCYYCERITTVIPTRRKDPNQLTFDRIDNSQTHHKSNLKVSCWQCNELRSNTYTSMEFYDKRRS